MTAQNTILKPSNTKPQQLNADGRDERANRSIGTAHLAHRNSVENLQGKREHREDQYGILFQANPQPMWVFDSETLAFLDVNGAATQHYGYSRDEFLAMTIKDIRPDEDVPGHSAKKQTASMGMVATIRPSNGGIERRMAA